MTVHLQYAYLLLLHPSASDVFAKVVRIHVFITFIVETESFLALTNLSVLPIETSHLDF